MKYCLVLLLLNLLYSPIQALQGQEGQKACLDPKEWHLTIAEAVKPYFTAPYKDRKYFTYKIIDNIYSEPEDDQKYVTSRKIEGIKFTVYRPNHGFGHGMRQAYLMGDIITAFHQKSLKSAPFDNSHAIKFMQWVNEHLNTDPNFIKKVELLAAFQRTGRQSEINEASNEQVYAGYREQDGQNFYNFAKDYVGEENLFKSESELITYQRALSTFPESKDEYFLARLLRLSHILDLKRVLGYKAEPMLDSIGVILCYNVPMTDKERVFLKALWRRSSEYLEITGETDLDNPSRQTYTNDFYRMANDAPALVDALEIVKARPLPLK